MNTPFDDDNPYAPPPLGETDVTRVGSKGGLFAEFRRPERFRLKAYLLFMTAAMLGGILIGLGIGGLFVTVFFWIVVLIPPFLEGAHPEFQEGMKAGVHIYITLAEMVLLPLTALMLWYLPRTLHYNGLARWIAEPCLDRMPRGKPAFLVQMTFTPRHVKGWRCLDDADDIGYLFFDGGTLRFEGDCCSLALPFTVVERGSIASNFNMATLLSYLVVPLQKSDFHEWTQLTFGLRQGNSYLEYYRESNELLALLRYWAVSGKEPEFYETEFS